MPASTSGLLAASLRTSTTPNSSPSHEPLAIQIQKAGRLQQGPSSPTSVGGVNVISDYFVGKGAADAITTTSTPPSMTPAASMRKKKQEGYRTRRAQSAAIRISFASAGSSSVCSASHTERARCKNCARRIFLPNDLEAVEEAQFCSGECLWSWRWSSPKISAPAPSSRFIGPPGPAIDRF